MGTVKYFEDLTLWQESRQLCTTIYSILQQNRDFGFKDQIQRASVSIMNNIAEGFERSSNKQFCYFLNIAKASCGEVRSMIYLAQDLKYVTCEEATQLKEQCKKISVSIYKLQKYLQDNS